MKTVFKILLILLAVAIFLFALFFFWIQTHTNYGAGGKGTGMKKEGLVFWNYRVSGGMAGGCTEISAEYTEKNGKVLLTEYRKPHNGAKGKTRTRRADASLLDEIEKTVTESGMRSWQELGPSEIQVLDADTARVTIGYSDGSRFTFSDTQDLPDGWRKEVDRINSIILQKITGAG